MNPIVDIVTVFHREENYKLAMALAAAIDRYDPWIPWEFIGVDNRVNNVGFAKGCNIGARQGTAPVIGFLNPDLEVHGPFLGRVLDTLAYPGCVITGSNFGKHPNEYKKTWRCDDWVCGAAMFVRRDFFEMMHGFDEQFVWGWEETDLIRRAQAHLPRKNPVRSIDLPFLHDSPSDNPPEDVEYKHKHFEAGAELFWRKWPR